MKMSEGRTLENIRLLEQLPKLLKYLYADKDSFVLAETATGTMIEVYMLPDMTVMARDQAHTFEYMPDFSINDWISILEQQKELPTVKLKATGGRINSRWDEIRLESAIITALNPASAEQPAPRREFVMDLSGSMPGLSY